MSKTHIIVLLASIAVASCLGPFPTIGQHPSKPRTGSSKMHVPTNTWYQNWNIGNGEQPVHTYPYILKATKEGLIISYTGPMVVQPTYVLEVFNANLLLSTREGFGEPRLDASRVNGDESDLGAQLNFGQTFSVTAIRGAASLVARVNGATPVFKTIHAIISQQKFSDRSFKVGFNNGQTWLFQSQNPIQWNTNNNEVFASSSVQGWIKISIVTGNEAERALVDSQDSVITNGKISHSVDRANRQVVVKIDYNAQGLYYILPHSLNVFGTDNVNGATAKGIKGTYQLSRGTGYGYKVPVFDSDFNNKAPITSSPEKKAKLLEALRNDVNLPIQSKDPYFGGKELARTANMIELADILGDMDSKTKARNRLVDEFENFWFGVPSNSPGLVYEPTWGGIVSKKSVGSMEADFGIYYYNDHHFHFGYFIMAAATLAKHYPDYYNSRREHFNIILADFAGTCTYKELPCKARNKDPFLGHSYAAGLFEFADSRNQESTSEAVNSYFAVKKLALALNDQSLLDLADYLLSTEIVATQTYWQIKQGSKIYPEPFAKNGVVGILWETKVDYATWFGANVEYIYGIQMLPFTDINTKFLDKQWLTQSRPVWSSVINHPSISDEWKGILLLSDAIVDPNRSGLSSAIHNLRGYDNGNCRSNSLYFYYMVGGSVSEGGVGPTVTPQPPTGSTGPVVTNPTTDQGKPDPGCGAGLFGCHTVQGTLAGCYDPALTTCFLGGTTCIKPYLACIIPSAPVLGAACYDPALYGCVNGQLNFIG